MGWQVLFIRLSLLFHDLQVFDDERILIIKENPVNLILKINYSSFPTVPF